MVRPGRERLEGCVEVDETYLGGVEEGVHGRETENKAIVAVAAEEDGRGIGRIRLWRIADVSADSLHPFVEQCVTPGAIVHTDGWPGYNSNSRRTKKWLNPRGKGQLALLTFRCASWSISSVQLQSVCHDRRYKSYRC